MQDTYVLSSAVIEVKVLNYLFGAKINYEEWGKKVQYWHMCELDASAELKAYIGRSKPAAAAAETK